MSKKPLPLSKSGRQAAAAPLAPPNARNQSVEWQTVDRALSTLLDAVAPPTTSKGAKQRRLPPILTAAHPHARVAAMASLLRETLRSSSGQDHLSLSVLDLAGCGVELSDFPMISSVLNLCPNIHTIDLRSRLDGDEDITRRMSLSTSAKDNDVAIAFLEAVLRLVTDNERLCRVIVDDNDTAAVADRSSGVQTDTQPLRSTGRGQFRRQHRHQQLSQDELHDAILNTCQANQRACDAHNETQHRLEYHLFGVRQQQHLHDAVLQLLADDSAARKSIADEAQVEWASMEDKKQRAVKSLASALRKKLHVVAHQRQIQQVIDEEHHMRAATDNAESVEMRLIVEADCGFRTRFIIAEELRHRRQYKQEETSSWVLTRRAEKARYALELAAREALLEDERTARAVIAADLDRDSRVLQQLRDASAVDASATEQARIDKLRRDEALRKRLEDQARERAEKEEAQRQKALREFLLKQQQAREKMETDAGVVRKSLRTLEAAAYSCVLRIVAAWMPFLHARHEAEKATVMYCKLLVELPSSALQLPHAHSYIHTTAVAALGASEPQYRPHLFVTEGTKEWLHVTSPSNFTASVLNPHRRSDDHFGNSSAADQNLGGTRGSQVPRISLWGSQNPLTITTTPPPEHELTMPHHQGVADQSAPQSPTIGTAGSFQNLAPPAPPCPPMFTVSLRDAWMAQTKASQQEFRSRLNKFENVKSSSRAKVQDELKAYSAVIQQHRVEYARWRWSRHVALAAVVAAPLASPSSKSPATFSPTTHSPATSTTTAVTSDAAFVMPEALGDPLVIEPVRPGDTLAINPSAQEQVMFEVDSYMKKMATCTPHHDFLTVQILGALSEDDIRVVATSMLASFTKDSASSINGGLNAEASVNFGASTTTTNSATAAKEPPVALLRTLKESIEECSISCEISGETSSAETDFLRFDLVHANLHPSASIGDPQLQHQSSSASSGAAAAALTTDDTAEVDMHALPVILTDDASPNNYPNIASNSSIVWLPDRLPPAKRFDNRFLSHGSARSGFRFGSPRANGSSPQHGESALDLGGPGPYHHAGGLEVAAANALQYRLDLESTAEAIREAAMQSSPPPTSSTSAHVDYTAISQAKDIHDFLSSDTMKSTIAHIQQRSEVEHGTAQPHVMISNNSDLQLLDAATARRIERKLMSICEYDACTQFHVTLQPKAFGTPRPTPGNTTPPPEAGLLSPDPTIAVSLDDGAPLSLMAPNVSAAGLHHHNPRTDSDAGSRNEQIIADITKMFNSVEYYARVGARDGLRGVFFRVQWSTTFDAAATSIAFHVLRCLQRKGPSDALTIDSKVTKHETLCVVAPILVMAPRQPPHVLHSRNPALLTKADACVVIPPTQSAASGFTLAQQHQPPRLFKIEGSTHEQQLIENIDSIRSLGLESIGPAAVASSPVTSASQRFTALPFRIHDDGPKPCFDRPLDAGCELIVTVSQAVMSATRNSPNGLLEPQICFSSDVTMWFTVIDQYGQKKDARSPLGTVFFSPTSDGLHGIPILEVVSGVCMSCGTVPLAHSSSSVSAAVNVARKLSRKVSTAVGLHSARRHSTSSTTARGERASVIFRTEPGVATPTILAEFVRRLSCASTSGNSFHSRSQPATPRGKDGSDVAASSTFRVDVLIRPPALLGATPHNSARDGLASGSVPGTPREEHVNEASNVLVLSNRLFRHEMPVISCYVEAQPPTPHPIIAAQQAPSASPRAAQHNPTNIPCGAYWLRSAEPINVFLGDKREINAKAVELLATVAPLRHCQLRLQMPDDATGFDAGVVFTIVVSTVVADLDDNLTPVETSRVASPSADANVQSTDDSHLPTAPFFLRLPMKLANSRLFECQGEGEPMAFLSVRTDVLRSILPLEQQVDDEPSATIQIATMKSEDQLHSMTISVSLRQLLEWVHRKLCVPAVFSRFLVPLILESLVSDLSMDIVQAPSAASFVGSMSLMVDIEVKTHVEDDPKPVKGKKGKPVAPPTPEMLAQLQHSILQTTAQVLTVHSPPAQAATTDFITTHVAFRAPTCSMLLLKGKQDSIIGGSETNSSSCVGVVRLRRSNEIESTLFEWCAPPLGHSDSASTIELAPW